MTWELPPGSRARRATRASVVLLVVVLALVALFVPAPPHPGVAAQVGPKQPRIPGWQLGLDPQFAPITLTSLSPTYIGEFGLSVAMTSSRVVIGAPFENSGVTPDAGQAYIRVTSSGAVVVLKSTSPILAGEFGWSVAASGGYVVVGAPFENVGGVIGAGHVYLFNSSGGLLRTFSSPNALKVGEFGYSVAISGNTIVVGAPYENDSGYIENGNAYFLNITTGAIRQIFSPNPQNSGLFGSSVSISGPLAIVGAADETSGGSPASGNAYAFSDITGNAIETIPNPAPTTNGHFGSSVAIYGATAVVGAPLDSSYAGSAFQINLDTDVITALSSPFPLTYGDFGASVAIDGASVLVGAPDETSGGNLGAGNAYLFSEANGALITSDFNAPAWPYGGTFGASVAELGSTIVIGAPGVNGTGVPAAGQAYIFNQIPLTVASEFPISSGALGQSVGIDNHVMVVGAPGETASGDAAAGNAYLVRVDANPGASLSVIHLTSPSPVTGGFFGNAVAVSAGLVAVGAPGEMASGDPGAGNVYIFSSTTGALQSTLSSPNPVAGGEFGFSLGIMGNLLVVGAPGETYSGDLEAGRAYVFNPSTDALTSTLSSANPLTNGQFGYSVAVDATTAIVGAPGETMGGSSAAGHAYLFTPSTGTLIATLVTPNPITAGGFGVSVGVNASSAVVGAPFETAAGLSESGHAYVFSPTTGTLLFTLVSPNALAGGEFGQSVSANGGLLVVGAPGETVVGLLGAGAIYVFTASTASILDRYYSPDVQTSGEFGESVWIGQSRIVVGAPGQGAGHSADLGNGYIFGFETQAIEP